MKKRFLNGAIYGINFEDVSQRCTENNTEWHREILSQRARRLAKFREALLPTACSLFPFKFHRGAQRISQSGAEKSYRKEHEGSQSYPPPLGELVWAFITFVKKMRLRNYPKTYQTERLLLRPLDIADAKSWADFLAHPKANALFPKFLTENTTEQSLLWIERQICRYRDLQGGLLAITDKKTGEFMGQAGLIIQEVDGIKVLEVGYHLHPKFWGKGYATEAATFFRELGFQIADVNSIISIIDVRNENSKKVARRNGMEVSKSTTWRNLNVEIFRINRPG